jgi:hypothetical protein
MTVEIWAMDAGGGTAILRTEGGWLIISVDDAWRPAEMELADVARRLLTGGMSRLGIHSATIEEAVVACRRARRLVLASGDLTDSGLKQAFAEEPPKTSSERQALATVSRQLDRLDRFFRRRGRTYEESFRLLLDLLVDLERRSSRGELSEHGLAPLELFKMAVALADTAPADRFSTIARPPTPAVKIRRRSLEQLSQLQLGCLALWADGTASPEQIGRMLRLSARLVQDTILSAANALGSGADELRSADIAAGCRQELERRLDLA